MTQDEGPTGIYKQIEEKRSMRSAAPRYKQVVIEVLAKRDGWTCRYCGVKLTKQTATIDHYLPRSKGGRTVLANLALACLRCNVSKGGSVPLDISYTQDPSGRAWVEAMEREEDKLLEDFARTSAKEFGLMVSEWASERGKVGAAARTQFEEVATNLDRRGVRTAKFRRRRVLITLSPEALAMVDARRKIFNFGAGASRAAMIEYLIYKECARGKVAKEFRRLWKEQHEERTEEESA